MLVHRAPSARPSSLLTPRETQEPKVAVVLNANASQVNKRVVQALSHAVPEGDLFLSRSEVDARRIAYRVIDGRYDTVFCGGGDGTFVTFASELVNQFHRLSRSDSAMPRFGMLKLGTGNGLADFLRASAPRGDGFVDDVLRARSGDVPRYRRLDLLCVDKKRTPFAGLGADAGLLNDYLWLKARTAKGVFRRLFTGRRGYFSAVALKTLPSFLTRSPYVECEVTNGMKSPAYRLGPHGTPVGEPIAPGELLFRGKAMMAAAGTIPFYGFQFKMFPFANLRPGFMHLRLGAMSATSILAHLPKLWRGRWFPQGLHDFHASEAVIRFERPMPFQVGGDAAGYRQEIEVSVAPERMEMVDFNTAVQ